MQMNEGAPLPVDADVRYYPLCTPKGADVVKGTILADTFHGEWSHWYPVPGGSGRTVRCSKQEGECEYCGTGRGERWGGYIAFLDSTYKSRVVLALSEGAARVLLAELQKRKSLRGLIIETWRKIPSKVNSPQLIKVAGRQEGTLPPAHDIFGTLGRMFNLNAAWLSKRAQENSERYGGPLPRRDEYADVPVDEPVQMTAEEKARVGRILGDVWRMPD